MTRLERIARDLAAVLSPHGQDDWRCFVPMAEDVGARLYRQLEEIMPSQAHSSQESRRAA